MRRVTLISMMLVLLAACGVADQPTSAPSPVSQSAQANAYPTPVVATAIPTSAPPTATPAPTVVASAPTATPKTLTITKIQSLSVSKQDLPVDALLGWSPDHQYFLYSRVDRFDQASQFLLGELYTLNTTTGEDSRIPKKDIILGVHSQDYVVSLGTALWSPECCTILTSSLDSGKQAISTIDLKTKKEKPLKTVDGAMFGYQGKKVGLVEKGAFSLDNVPVSTTFLNPSSALTSTILTKHGLYTHNGRDLRYISDTTTTWDMRGDVTFLQGKPALNIFRFVPSPDETMVALVVAARGSKSRELWLINRITNTYELLKATEYISYPSWSADGHYLMYRESGTLMVVDVVTKIATPALTDANIPVWHPTKPWFAVLNRDARTIDVYEVRR